MTLGVWKNELFAFGGVPRIGMSDIKHSCFFTLSSSEIVGFGNTMNAKPVPNISLGLMNSPQFTVSTKYTASDNKAKPQKYRVFIIAHKNSSKFEIETYKIFRDADDKIALTPLIEKKTESFRFIDQHWADQGFLEEQSFCLLNSFVD